MGFKDRFISFILMLLITMILLAIGVFGYIMYKEIFLAETEIEVSQQNTHPNVEFSKNENNEISFKPEMEIIEEPKEETSKVKSRYLYQQLDSTAKTIYDKIYSNRENMKTGTYTIEFGKVFSNILSQEDGDKKLQSHYQSAIEALMYENPDMFFIDATKMYLNIETTTKLLSVSYNVYISPGENANYLANGLTSQQDVKICEAQIEEAKNTILSYTQGKSTYEKIKIVHDYLINNVEYDTTVSQSNIYNIYGALVLKKCVCEGYAKSYQYLMNELGVENVLVIGKATNDQGQTENHAWNYVDIDGNWYAVDVTWDDPIIVGGGDLTDKNRYKYFLKGSQTINKNHIILGNFTENGKIFEYPDLNIEDYHK